ncbi:MAG: rhomboid family intramembrane serine protease [Bacteroidota bacterium]
MRVVYNAPVILTYALICTALLIIQEYTPLDIMELFTVYPVFDFANPVWYFRLFSHALGHGDWAHLVGNFTLILLIGPILEEKYGSKDLFFMILVTAFVTGLLQIAFFNHALLGASGVAFMLILLSSFTNNGGGIPLTFILVVILFLGKEVLNSFGADQVSQFAHIIGGILGGIFGFFLEGGQKAKANPN